MVMKELEVADVLVVKSVDGSFEKSCCERDKRNRV